MKKLLLAVAAFVLAVPLFAADNGNGALPQGKWWRRPEVIRELALSAEQQTRLDTIFRDSANQLIDLRGEVEKRAIDLRGELDQPQLNRQSIQRAAARLSEARGRLFERELMMLYDMRQVLSADQWNRMRNQLQERRPGPQQRRR